MSSSSLRLLTALLVIAAPCGARADLPDAIAAPGEVPVATMHAEGAQIYDCKADASGKLVWQFREPIATLLMDGKTVGRHYAGRAGNCWMEAPLRAKSRRAIRVRPAATFPC